jgi:hypothetical protein
LFFSLKKTALTTEATAWTLIAELATFRDWISPRRQVRQVRQEFIRDFDEAY